MVPPGFDALSTTKGEVRRGSTLARSLRTESQTGKPRQPYVLKKDQCGAVSTEYVIGSDYPLRVKSIWPADASWCYDWFVDSLRARSILNAPSISSVNRTASSVFLSSSDQTYQSHLYPEVSSSSCVSSPDEFGVLIYRVLRLGSL